MCTGSGAGVQRRWTNSDDQRQRDRLLFYYVNKFISVPLLLIKTFPT